MKMIKSFIHTPIVTVELDDSLAVIKDIFDHTTFHHLLVVENHKLKGVISDRDLLKALSPNIGTLAERPHDIATLNKRAHQIMSRNLHTLPASATLNDAIELLLAHRVSCIPIINPLHEVEGIITWRDLLPELLDPMK